MKKLIFYSSFLLILVCAFFSISYKYHTEIWGITSLETTTLITKNLYEDDCDACKRCEGIRNYGIFVVKYDDSTTEALCVSKEIYMSYNISDCYVVEKSNGMFILQVFQSIIGALLMITIAGFLLRIIVDDEFCRD
jgi:hypothetical protein